MLNKYSDSDFESDSIVKGLLQISRDEVQRLLWMWRIVTHPQIRGQTNNVLCLGQSF